LFYLVDHELSVKDMASKVTDFHKISLTSDGKYSRMLTRYKSFMAK